MRSIFNEGKKFLPFGFLALLSAMPFRSSSFQLHSVKKIALAFFFFAALQVRAQDGSTDNGDDQPKLKSIKGFHLGMYMGSYFAGKYSAYTYDGYGFDRDGNKNNFYNSVLYRRIVYDYGGGNNQPDRIAPAIGVAPGDWSFDSTDMPAKMRYNIAFQFGLNTRYCYDDNNALVMDLDAIKLTATGDFTITKVNYNTSTTSGPQGPYIYQPFAIVGTEERLVFRFGYQHISGDRNTPFRFFYEIGPDLMLARVDRVQTNINGLQIDLNAYYTQPLPGYSAYRPKNFTGEGFGLFGGMGLDINTGGKWSLQFLYSPSYDLVKIGQDPKRKFQNAVGLRMYYNL
jgi:hypothetical protein